MAAQTDLVHSQEPGSPIHDKELGEAVHSELLLDLSQEDREFLENFGDEHRKKVMWKVRPLCGV